MKYTLKIISIGMASVTIAAAIGTAIACVILLSTKISHP